MSSLDLAMAAFSSVWTSFLLSLHLRCDLHSMGFHPFSTEVGQFDFSYLYSPLLAVLVHEGRENLIVEALHAFATNAETLAIDVIIIDNGGVIKYLPYWLMLHYS